MAALYLIAATANAWALIGILAAALAVQFVTGELPCPLCFTQRIALMFCALGPIYMLIRQRAGELSTRDLAVGAGISVVTGLFGSAAAGRQVLLHILPGDAGYGDPILGVHLYTWALIAFLAHIAAAGLMLVGAAWLPAERTRPWPLTTPTVLAFTAIVVVNILAVIAEAGFNWTLPENPTRYLLFGA